jgi:hypoxanthine phosphoribosyltransferase
MDEDLEVLFDEEDIREKIAELAERISRDYAGKDMVLVCVLKGGAVFAADLARGITAPVTMDYVRAASYRSSTVPSQEVSIEQDIVSDIRGRHVLLVDGIVDSGKTIAFLLGRFWERQPASLRVAVLLDKRSRRAVDVPIDYRGFEAPDRFVVGFGMDAAEKYRNLPFVAALRTEGAS